MKYILFSVLFCWENTIQNGLEQSWNKAGTATPNRAERCVVDRQRTVKYQLPISFLQTPQLFCCTFLKQKKIYVLQLHSTICCVAKAKAVCKNKITLLTYLSGSMGQTFSWDTAKFRWKFH